VRMADDHADEGGDVEPEPTAVEERAVAGDHARGLELLHPLEYCGCTEPDLLAQPHERGSTVLLEQLEEPYINVVGFDFRVLGEFHKVRKDIGRTLVGSNPPCQSVF